ncbi:MAG: hypothetical protein JO264_18030 [Acidisphaera sp.]|nr:hypothetical protein [Acidisphaera sp.]
MLHEPEPREVKLLSDILALVLSDEAGQAGAALEALRRKARQGRISGGAIKDVFLRISRSDAGSLEPTGDVGDWTAANLLIAQLRRTVRDDEQELAAERRNSRALEVGLLELRREFSELQERHAGVERKRWWWLGGGVAAGALTVGIVALAGLALERPRQPVAVAAVTQAPKPPSAPVAEAAAAPTPGPTMTPAERAAVGQFVRSCWMTSTNSVYAGRFPLNVLVQTDETGTIRAARVADADVPRLTDPQFHEFAELAIRSLLEPRCATLPLPPSMIGQRRVFDIHFGP